MVHKTFINLKRSTWEAIEKENFADGNVFDYPLSELDDLLSGKVGDEEQPLYARTVCDDGEVRLGELKNIDFKYDSTDYYCLAEDDVSDCIDVFVDGGDEKTVCTDLGAMLDAAHKAFLTDKYKNVTVFGYVAGEFVDIYTFSK